MIPNHTSDKHNPTQLITVDGGFIKKDMTYMVSGVTRLRLCTYSSLSKLNFWSFSVDGPWVNYYSNRFHDQKWTNDKNNDNNDNNCTKYNNVWLTHVMMVIIFTWDVWLNTLNHWLNHCRGPFLGCDAI